MQQVQVDSTTDASVTWKVVDFNVDALNGLVNTLPVDFALVGPTELALVRNLE